MLSDKKLAEEKQSPSRVYSISVRASDFFKVQSFQTCDARSVGKNSNKEKIDRGKKLFHFLTGFGISSFDKFPRAAVFRPASEGDSDLTSSGVSFW